MTISINQNYVNQFSNNLYLLLEQKGSKLKGLFTEEAANGEKHFFDRLGNFAVEEITSRLEPVNLQDPAHSRRMATVRKYHASTYIDNIDQMKMLIDPSNEYARKLANKHGHNFDQRIIEAMLGTAATGKDGDGTQAFDTSNQQIAHGGVGLTSAKIDQALRIMMDNDVDMNEELFLLVGGMGIEDLLQEAKLTSFDYQPNKVLGGKSLPMYRGINILHVSPQQLAQHTAGSVSRALLVHRDAMKVALNKDIEIKTAERPDLNFAQQISTYMSFGAVRVDEMLIVDILYQ
jgi:hypothetical protein